MADPLVTNDKQAWLALKEHGAKIVWVIVLVLLGYFGWQYYQKNYAKIDTVAADSYTAIAEQVATLNLTDDTATQSVFADIDALVLTHPNTVYAWQALMMKAGFEVDSGNYEQAIATLTKASNVGLDDKGLLAISQLQLARTQLAKGDIKAALETANATYPASFEASRLEVLGDIHVANNDIESAKAAYGTAWELLRARDENRALLGLKMQALGMTVEPIDKAQVVSGERLGGENMTDTNAQ